MSFIALSRIPTDDACGSIQLWAQLLQAFFPQLQEHALSLRDKRDGSEDDDLYLSHLKFLISFVKKEHASTLKEIAKLLILEEITYELLWAILLPRTIIYTECPTTGEPLAVRLINAGEVTDQDTNRRSWRLYAEYIDYNSQFHSPDVSEGTPKFGFASVRHELKIRHFEGPVKISSLSSFPLKCHPRCDELEDKLIARGKKWSSLQGVHHKYYKAAAASSSRGKIFVSDSLLDFVFTHSISDKVDSRVMIDWSE